MARPIRVGIHLFETYKRHGGRDGANLAYSEIGHLLADSAHIELVPHNLLSLFADDKAAYSALASCDVVVATVGPHSYIYFYLRERFGLQFRIIRDVRTALWNGYLLQEALIAPYLRPEDTVLYSSTYSRDLFRVLFPKVPLHSQYICYPLLHWFPPQDSLQKTRARAGSRVYTIGYVGRLTADKNFPQALDLIFELERRRPGRFRLCAVGEGRSPSGDKRAPRERLGSNFQGYLWVPPVSRDQIWAYYSTFDLLFFPSTSSLETFGRVLAEATYAGVPVLASNHGAASELLDQEALLATNYYCDRQFTTHLATPLGEVNVANAVLRILEGPAIPLSHGYLKYCDDAAHFTALVRCGNGAVYQTMRRPGTQPQADFIARIAMYGLSPTTTPAEADQMIADLRRHFAALHQWYGPRYALALLELLVRSRFRRKTLHFISRSLFQHEDFTNIGGIDLQFSHLLRFYPSFEIKATS